MQTKTNVCYRTYFQLEDEEVKILVKLLPLLQIQQYSLVGHNIIY